MADNKIEVEYITTVAGALTAIEKLNKRLDAQEQKVQKIGDTSKKATDMAIGSFNRLEAELKQNEAALKSLTMGTSAFAQQKQKVDQLRGSLSAAKAELSAAGERGGGAMAAGVQKLAGFAAGMLTMQTAITAIVNELDRAKTLRLEAAGTARSVEESVAAMALNIGAGNVPQAQEMIRQRAPELGVSMEGLASLLAAGISGGAKDLTEAMNLAALTLKLTAGNAQTAQPIMSGMLSMAATTGNRDFKAVLGQLSQFQQAARGEDLATSINNMASALAAANIDGQRMRGLGGERTLEVASVMSQVLQDPRMAVTGTALRQMVQKLDVFTAKTEAKLDDGSVSRLSREQAGGFNGLTTFDSRLQALRQNPELRNQFLSTVENSEGKVAIREMVTGSQKVLELEKAAGGIVTPINMASVAFEELAEVIGKNTQLLQADNKLQAALQVQDTAGTRAAEGQAVKIVDDTLDKMNLSYLDADTRQKIAWGMESRMAQGQDAASSGIAALEEAKQTRRLFGVIPVGGSVSAEDRQRADTAIQLLRQISEATRQQKNIMPGAQAMRPKEAPLPAVTTP